MLEAAVSEDSSDMSEDDGSYESDFVVSDGSASEEVPCGARLGYNVRLGVN